MSKERKEELFCAKVLESTFLSGITLSIGDSEKEHLPDLYTSAREYGIEVTQLEKQKDFIPMLITAEDDELFHSTDWLKTEYFDGLKKKHKKLNNDNYSGISGDVDLCVCAIRRAHRVFNPMLILYLYKDICKQNSNKKFKKIFYISSKSVFLIVPDKVSKIIPIKSGETIYHFKIEGSGYVHEWKYEINDFSNLL